jgi:hypothetical protein
MHGNHDYDDRRSGVPAEQPAPVPLVRFLRAFSCRNREHGSSCADAQAPAPGNKPLSAAFVEPVKMAYADVKTVPRSTTRQKQRGNVNRKRQRNPMVDG